MIINSDGEYLMYYVYDWYGDNSVHAASSTDGIAWTRFRIIGFKDNSMDPDVIQLDDGSYRIYFVNYPILSDFRSGPLSIHSAVSSDEVTWTYRGIEIQPAEPWERTWVGDPDTVEIGNGSHRMYYYGMDENDNSDIVSAVSQW